MATKNNMELYEQFRSVPKEAQKKITGGRLNGFTDINPMWRLKKLTETFGPQGVGFYFGDIQQWTESGNGETAVFVTLNLYVKRGEEWSKPIAGFGGSKLLSYEGQGNNRRLYLDDDAFKKAFTDAISIACKGLGMAADIYFDKDIKTRDNQTKYDQNEAEPQAEQSAFKPMSNKDFFKCVETYANGYEPENVGNVREYYIRKTHAGAKEIALFDEAVNNYKINQLQQKANQ